MGVEAGLHLGRGIGFHKTFQDGGGCLNKAMGGGWRGGRTGTMGGGERSEAWAGGEGPPSSQDEALARDGVSREVPCSALKGETEIGRASCRERV